MRVSRCYELLSSAERNKREIHQSARGRSTQCTTNSDPITSTSELLLRQNSVSAHAHQSSARRLSSNHCAIENHRPISAVQPIRCTAGNCTNFLEFLRFGAPTSASMTSTIFWDTSLHTSNSKEISIENIASIFRTEDLIKQTATSKQTSSYWTL
jgi:hypothetical protein